MWDLGSVSAGGGHRWSLRGWEPGRIAGVAGSCCSCAGRYPAPIVAGDAQRREPGEVDSGGEQGGRPGRQAPAKRQRSVDRTAASPAYTCPADQAHSVELSRFEQAKLTAATGIKDARSQDVADLANALLTTALETCGRSWTPAGANAPYRPISWPVVDSPGPANPPEKRKVDSSILSLTTSFGLVSSALTRANADLALSCSQPLGDHDCPCVTVVGRPLSHADRTPRRAASGGRMTTAVTPAAASWSRTRRCVADGVALCSRAGPAWRRAHGGASIGSAACGGCSEVDRLDVRLAGRRHGRSQRLQPPCRPPDAMRCRCAGHASRGSGTRDCQGELAQRGGVSSEVGDGS